MVSILRCIRADMIKSKHTPLLLFHLLFPVIGTLLFVGYFHVSGWSETVNVSVFLEVMAIVFPFLIGIVVGFMIQLEHQAGHFQLILGTIKSRSSVYLGKLIYFVLLAFISIILSVTIFAILYPVMPLVFYLKITPLLLLMVSPIYLLSLLVGLIFGKSASMGLGIVGSLISALMLTGIGDGIWKFIPWAWGVRFMDYFILKQTSKELPIYLKNEYNIAFYIVITTTVVLLIISLVWFNYWEGGKTNE